MSRWAYYAHAVVGAAIGGALIALTWPIFVWAVLGR